MAAQPENLHSLVLELPSGRALAALFRMAAIAIEEWEKERWCESTVLESLLFESTDHVDRLVLTFETVWMPERASASNGVPR